LRRLEKKTGGTDTSWMELARYKSLGLKDRSTRSVFWFVPCAFISGGFPGRAGGKSLFGAKSYE
jgi:hypothetical protein